ncbi:MAG: hypothetical protein GY716_24730 [bacterium]|nr:hypothetical protein [bacterium]
MLAWVLLLWFGMLAATAHAGEVPFSPPADLTSQVDLIPTLVEADLDRDGDLDLLYSSSVDDRIAWLENLGDAPVPSFVQHDITFNPDPVGTPQGVADGPEDVLAVDMDGDGDLDVAFASFRDDQIGWFENLLETEPGSPDQLFAGAPHVVTFDTDGAPDGSGWSTCWSQTWGFGTANGEMNLPVSIAAADLDRDGDVDLAVAAQCNGRIAWFENDGLCNDELTPCDGSDDCATGDCFDLHEVFLDPNAPSADPAVSNRFPFRSIDLADVDGDGDLDVLSAARRPNSLVAGHVQWHENRIDDALSWTAREITPGVFGLLQRIEARDLDADGDIDAVIAEAISTGPPVGRLSWLENLGGDPIGFEQHVVEDIGAIVSSGMTHDVDRDGDPDLVMSATLISGPDTCGADSEGRVAWFENLGQLRCVASGTVCSTDNDCGMGDDCRLFAEGSTTLFSSTVEEPRRTAVADLDGDGDPEIAWATQCAACALHGACCACDIGSVGWSRNLSIHRSALFPLERNIVSPSSRNRSVWAGDLDGDGDVDVASVQTTTVGVIEWYRNLDGKGTFSAPILVSDQLDEGWVVFGDDVDGDGDIDLLSASRQDDKIAWYDNDGNGNFTQVVISTTVEEAIDVSTGDVDGDGHLDVLSVASGSGSGNDGAVYWHENDGTPAVGAWAQHELWGMAGGASSVVAEDFDRDGKLDVLWTEAVDNVVRWRRNDGGGTFDPVLPVAAITDPWRTSVADVDNDGDLDVVVVGHFGPLDDNSVVWIENTDGAGTWGPAQTITENADGPFGVFTGDADLDGDVDVFVASVEDDTIVWHESSGGAPPAWTEHVLTDGADYASGVYAADIDSDGDLDLLSASYLDNRVAWFENLGGQFSLKTTDVAPPTQANSDIASVLRIDASHRGRAGDADLELATLDLLFETSPGSPLTTGQANAVIERLSIHRDDGSGAFDPADVEVAAVGTLDLTNGVETVVLGDADPEVRVGPGATRSYFVVLETTADSTAEGLCSIQVSHLTDPGSTAEDRDFDIPLSLEHSPSATSGSIALPPRVVSVLPEDNTLGVAASANVTISFSDPVDPATLDASTLRLLDPGGAVVPANIFVAPSGLQATLDPVEALSYSTPSTPGLHTAELTSGATDVNGCSFAPFVSRFRTEEDPGPSSLPSTTPIGDVADRVGFPPGGPAPPLAPLGPTPPQSLGWSVSPAGDIGGAGAGASGDGIDDVLAGNPGFSDERGRAFVYFGRTLDPQQPLPAGNGPDIVFNGIGSHDRAGTTVGGGIDFNCDGYPDFLIGAEQVDRTSGSPVGVGSPGKVYLVFFDPTDPDFASHYPNLVDGNPTTTGDAIDLDQVGAPGGVPGLVFTRPGETTADRIGASVAVGPEVFSGSGTTCGAPDLILGAPGHDGGAGAVYLIRNTDALWAQGTVDLDCLTDAGCSDVTGLVYVGAAGDALGHDVAFAGDVTGSTAHDVAFGAPDSDPDGNQDAGAAYFVEGGALNPGSAAISTAGLPHIKGSDPGERLGYSVARADDHRRDGQDDLLVGAPDYDAPGRPDTGRVILTSTRLPAQSIPVGDIGTATLDGIVWEGFAAGDRLGFDVAGVGDVTGDGIDDVVLGAPMADPLGTGSEDAGIAYVIEGPSRSGVCSATFTCTEPDGAGFPVRCDDDAPCTSFGGTCDLNRGFLCGQASDCLTGNTCDGGSLQTGLVEGTIAGFAIAGNFTLDNLGYASSGGGMLNDANLVSDLVVGSPGSDGGSGDGAVWFSIDLNVPPPGTCNPALGCTVADLANGAQLSINSNALGSSAVFGVVGGNDPTLPAFEGRTLVGFERSFEQNGAVLQPCDFTPCETLTDPATLHIPVIESLQGQLTIGEQLELKLLLDEFNWDTSFVCGEVVQNPHYPGRLAIRAVVNEVRSYGVFVIDEDGDGVRGPPSGECNEAPANDCNDDEATCMLDCTDTDGDTVDDCADSCVDPDTDGHGFAGGSENTCLGDDCAPADGTAWAVPLAIQDLAVAPGPGSDTLLTWSPDASSGTAFDYDILRGIGEGQFACITTVNGESWTDTDPDPSPHETFYYVVRSENPCGSAVGTTEDPGAGNPPHDVPSCP